MNKERPDFSVFVETDVIPRQGYCALLRVVGEAAGNFAKRGLVIRGNKVEEAQKLVDNLENVLTRSEIRPLVAEIVREAIRVLS